MSRLYSWVVGKAHVSNEGFSPDRKEKEDRQMLSHTLLYIGSGIIILWGIAHIVPARSVVKGFGPISQDNRRIITMEWVSEGLTLCFIGLLVLFVAIFGQDGNSVSNIVYRAAGVMLLVMAVWTLVTGARTSIIPIKICPAVKTVVAALFLIASFL